MLIMAGFGVSSVKQWFASLRTDDIPSPDHHLRCGNIAGLAAENFRRKSVYGWLIRLAFRSDQRSRGRVS